MSVLVFAPHPDDDVIGCGGSIAKHANAGRHVCVAYLTSGDAGSRAIDRESLQEIREAEARSAAAVLGVTELIFLRYEDGYLGDSPELVRTVRSLIRERRPRVVYLPHGEDALGDHIVTHRVVMKALHQAAGPWFQETDGEPWTVPVVLAYEVWTPIPEVQYLEDISDVAQRVRVALGHHKSQLANIDYEAMSTGLAKYRGTMLGPGREAEAFLVVRVPTSLFTKWVHSIDQ